ncbi:probable protein phosphatase 2C 26 [Hibiscus syriacus]|uniref:probable protein phosphatase 2C 26 n=1 Tax=Hibiscus syriacus TaxID=106335 RepID=UPI0019217CBE|nr:probable protein phosphatase 2C 26 [Hibiscus syriacus]
MPNTVFLLGVGSQSYYGQELVMLLTTWQIIFSTTPHEHYFDCPYQLSLELIGQKHPDAAVSSVELVEGDTIVMGSDGLFDNVFDREIISTLAIHSDVVGAGMCSFLVTAVCLSRMGFDVPFGNKILGMKLTGGLILTIMILGASGKPDDITVIVGKVVTLTAAAS